MEWLNYHHLLYFWTVVREGSISKAAAHLRLAQPTVSAQVRQFEQALGETLLERRGRQVAVTEVGRLVFRYADEIFSLGRELQETLKGRPTGRAPRLRVGVANAVPKLIVYRLLQPAAEGATPMHVVCHEGQPDELLAQLAAHTLDVVISDMPAPPHSRVKVFSHLLGESATTFFAAPSLARRLTPRVSRRRCSRRRCSCRRRRRRCAARSSSGSRRSASPRRSPASSRIQPCSRRSASRDARSSRRPR